jgi:Xaa-Pro dipeptidase
VDLPFDRPTYVERLERVRARLQEAGLDGLILTLPHSIYWLTGFDTTGFAWTIVSRGADPVFVSRRTEEPAFNATSWLADGRFYDPDDAQPAQVVASVIEALGMGTSNVGIDLGSFGLLPSAWEDLKSRLPRVQFADATALIPELRYVKSPAEIAYQLKAAKIADYALLRVIEALRPGVTETQLQGIADMAVGEAGGEYTATPPMIAAGTRSALVHAMALSGRSAVAGDVVTIEVAAAVRRYHSVVMRSAVIGKPSGRVAAVAACQRDAIEAAMATIKPGVPVSQPEVAANEALGRLDLVQYRCHRLGYSMGIGYPPVWVEPMLLARDDPHVFAPGMSFTVEPNLALPAEGFGLKLGDTVLCTEDGSRSLTTFDHELVVVP